MSGIDYKRSSDKYFVARFSLDVSAATGFDYDVNANNSCFKSDSQTLGSSTNFDATKGHRDGVRHNISVYPTTNPIWVKFNSVNNDNIFVPAGAWFDEFNVIVHDMYISSAVTTQQVQTVQAVADVATSLNDTYFYAYFRNFTTGVDTTVGVWFDVDSGGTQPTDSLVDQWVEVDISEDDSANTVAAAVDTALEALTINSVDVGASSVSTDTVTFTHATAFDGGQGKWADGPSTSTGFTFATTTAGGADTTVQIVVR